MLDPMRAATRTADGKVVLYFRETGERFERWSVDAREMLATGAYTLDAPPAVNTTPREKANA